MRSRDTGAARRDLSERERAQLACRARGSVFGVWCLLIKYVAGEEDDVRRRRLVIPSDDGTRIRFFGLSQRSRVSVGRRVR